MSVTQPVESTVTTQSSPEQQRTASERTRQPIETIALAQLAGPPQPPVKASTLLVIITIMLAIMFCILIFGLYRTTVQVAYIQKISDQSVNLAKKGTDLSPQLALGIASYSASYESTAFNRLFTILLSYIIVFVGCIFVVGNQIAYYQLKLEGAQTRSALETSSPGLVLITLGCALVAVAVLVPKAVSLSVDDDGSTALQKQEHAGYGQQRQPAVNAKQEDHPGYSQKQPAVNAKKN